MKGTIQIKCILIFLPSQIPMSVVIANVTLVDNGMGIMPFVYGPPSLSHAYADKTVHVQVRGVTMVHLFFVFNFLRFHWFTLNE